MTKKDYERAAGMIQARGWGHDVAVAFSDFFAADNPDFDATRFMAATKPGANVRARGARKGDRRSSRQSRARR